MHVLALSVELRLPQSRSLKDKRQTLRPLLDGLRARHRVSVAEVRYQDQWQRTTIGVAVVAASPRQAEEWLDQVERFVWSRPDVEVVAADRQWMEFD
jgi:uncharacterized protein YlxP (DUF503 family)